ncbi:MAG: amidophosphoribosyltransferase [Puniceicoccales bacterium]|jgi:amidophosphoribosyltransferase|nr:amidophosphoribosyltransferase [Puniceicoccales bacterium]
MSDSIKHECGIAFIRLLKPLSFYEEKYKTPLHGFHQLFLLMEKQHNRGQDGAGIGCLKLGTPRGKSFMFRDRDPSAQALTNIFSRQLEAYNKKKAAGLIMDECANSVKNHFDFGGEILLGHLRYGTSGGLEGSSCHPYFRKSIWATRNLLLAGNFNIANTPELNESLIKRGAHPIFSTDTQTLLEELGFWLDEEHTSLYRQIRDEQRLSGEEFPAEISQRLDIAKILRTASRNWDGAYTLVGIIGNGDSFVLRDPKGIRPCFYLRNDEIFSVASERAALMTIHGASRDEVHELTPGHAIIIKSDGSILEEEILPPAPKKHCTFERIYFSRGNDPEIYQERKRLGAALAPKVLDAVGHDLEKSVFSYIPNTAEIAYYGFIHEIYRIWRAQVHESLLAASQNGTLTPQLLDKLLNRAWPRSEKIAHKDIKLRTFISAEKNRLKLASHVYDISHDVVHAGENLVVLDDSIVRGTTLRESIVRILSRPNPARIVICSTAPQIRYPDCYGIDMSELNKFLIFLAAIDLCKARKQTDVIHEIYKLCCKQLEDPTIPRENHVKKLYGLFTEDELSARATKLIRPKDTPWKGELILIFQSIENLHKACPTSAGDWYFTGDYPTPGGYNTLSRAFVNFYENRKDRSY